MEAPRGGNVVGVWFRVEYCCKCAVELGLLSSSKVCDRKSGALAEVALHEEHRSQITYVLDGSIEPVTSGAVTGSGGDERLSSRGGVGTVSTQIPTLLKRVEASVGERSAQCPDPTDIAIGSQHANELPSMHWGAVGSGHNRQADTVSKGEVGHIARLVIM